MPRSRRNPWRAPVLAAVLAGLVVPLVRALPSRAATPVFSDAAGIHVEAVTAIDTRQLDVRVSSSALGRAVDVRVLLPASYDRDPAQRYPVLYLFHGTSGRASDWVDLGGAEATTAPLPLITVMPDAGFDGNGGGWFTDWVDTHTALGPSQWETFHVGQLVPWVDANLRTIASRNGRAVAGLSQGGFGSMTYAARHPDAFVSAASFSGAPDIDDNPLVAAGATAVIEATAVGLDGVEPDAMFGSRLTDEINWQGHDPADLVTNLRGVDLWLYTATGAPGPNDPTPANPGAMGIESLTYGSTQSFYQRAQQVGVPVHMSDETFGTHSWPYWARDLQAYVGPMMQTFADPPAPPASISYESIDQSWVQWGWSVTLRRAAAQQLSQLQNADANGFTLSGTGIATVVTPSFYPPDSLQTVTLSGIGGASTLHVTADSAGRLRLVIPLGGSEIPGAVGSAAVIGVPDVPPWPTTAVSVQRAGAG